MGLFGTFVFRPFFLPRVRTPLTHRRPTVRAVNDSFYTSSACVSWVFICLLSLFFPLFDYPPSYLHTHTHTSARYSLVNDRPSVSSIWIFHAHSYAVGMCLWMICPRGTHARTHVRVYVCDRCVQGDAVLTKRASPIPSTTGFVIVRGFYDRLFISFPDKSRRPKDNKTNTTASVGEFKTHAV